MDEEMVVSEIQPRNMFIHIAITQAICITVLILSVFIVKLFSPATYEKITDWYTENLLDETRVSEVFGEE